MDRTEQERLRELASYDVLDTPAEPIFDDLVRVAARVAEVPTSLVSLVDESRQWFKARIGLEVCSTDRDVAFCDHVVQSGRELEVPDARADPRFTDNPLVTSSPYFVFYAGFPLITPGGYVLGTLCVLGYEPHALSEDQRDSLRVLARQVMTELELRRRSAELVRSERDYQRIAEHVGEMVGRHAPDGRLLYLSPASLTILGFDHAAPDAPGLRSLVHPDDQEGAAAALAEVTAGTPTTCNLRLRDAHGVWRWMEVSLTPRFAADGSVAEIYSASRDVSDRTAAARTLAEGNALVRAVLESIATGIVACDADGHLTLFNPATLAFHGLPADSTLQPQEWAQHFDLFRADGVTPLPEEEIPLVRALRTGSVVGAEMVIAPRGLPSRLVSCDGTAMHDENGALLGAVVAMTDITTAREAEQALRRSHEALEVSAAALARSEARFRSSFESGPAPMCRLDAAAVVVEANPATRRLLARPSSDLVGASFPDLFDPADRHLVTAVLSETRRPDAGVSTESSPGAATPHYVEARLRRLRARSLWCEVAVTHAVDGDGTSHLLVLLADIDGRKQREADLERQATTDPLTELGNRGALLAHLDGLLASHATATVLCLDLDGFKAINDAAGHATGDEVLAAIGARLEALVRSSDLVARPGGDEFVLVFEDDPADPVRASVLVDRVRAAVEEPVRTGTGVQRVGVSIGVARLAPDDDTAAVLGRGDRSMYEDKRQRARTVPGPRAEPAQG